MIEIELSQLESTMEFASGTIFRIYGVNRFDIMQNSQDKSDEEKLKKDYYDIMVCDIKSKSEFYAINVTLGNDNRGNLYSILAKKENENVEGRFLNKVSLKEVRRSIGAEKVFLLDDGSISLS